MKKYITLAALLVAGTACANAAVESGTYTVCVDQQWTLNESTLYDFLNGAINEGGTLTFDLDIDYTGENCGVYQTLLHIGAVDTGLSIMANGGPKLLVGEKHETSDYANTNHEYGEGADLQIGKNDVQIIITGNPEPGTAKVEICINGISSTAVMSNNASPVADLVWETMAWSSTDSERNKYSVGCKAPGYSNAMQSQSTTLTAATVTFVAVPEPSAFGLLAGVGALALVASRRRRK